MKNLFLDGERLGSIQALDRAFVALDRDAGEIGVFASERAAACAVHRHARCVAIGEPSA